VVPGSEGAVRVKVQRSRRRDIVCQVVEQDVLHGASLPRLAVSDLGDDIEMADMPRVLLEQVEQDPFE